MHASTFAANTESSAERRLNESFARDLGDYWHVFPHVTWIGTDDMGRPRDGETDFVIAHPQLGILVIEVKGGRIRFDEARGHYISTDRDGIDHDIGDPFEQAMTSKYILLDKLRTMPGWPKRRVVLGHMVAFPDAVVQADWLRPNAPRQIIIDAIDMVSLESRLRGAIEFWRGNDTPPGPDAIGVLTCLLTQAEKIRHPLLAEQARTDEQTLVSLTEKQLRYLRFLRGQRRAAIAGCAGSGKTFLALEKARQLTQDEGLKVLFVCYNRALADYLGDGLGYRRLFDVFSFHQLCVHLGNQGGQHLPYQEDAPPEYFKTTLPNVILAGIDKLGSQYDAIIVDEGQDFRTEWWDPLPWLLHDPARGILYVFYDDNQRVYRNRSPIPIETAPFVLDENCRNTQSVFDVVGRFYQGTELPAVLGPVGQPAEIINTNGERDALAALRKTLHRLVNENGFKSEEIAVLTVRGVETSGVLGQRLGNFQLTERLPLASGEIFATTARRFKGLERAAIIVCEVDGQLSSQDVEMLLYVATSRAKTYLVLLVDQDAPSVIRKALVTPDQGRDIQS